MHDNVLGDLDHAGLVLLEPTGLLVLRIGGAWDGIRTGIASFCGVGPARLDIASIGSL